MTWTKLSDDFPDQCANLTDPAFRTHVEALVWTNRRETGGFITKRELNKAAETEHLEAAVVELLGVGWWTAVNGGYRINHHMEHQWEPDLIAHRRRLTAERQRRFRRRKAGMPDDDPE